MTGDKIFCHRKDWLGNKNEELVEKMCVWVKFGGYWGQAYCFAIRPVISAYCFAIRPKCIFYKKTLT